MEQLKNGRRLSDTEIAERKQGFIQEHQSKVSNVQQAMDDSRARIRNITKARGPKRITTSLESRLRHLDIKIA